MSDKVVVFDLDDTLYKEIDYVKSAFRYIAHRLNGATQNARRDDIYDTLWLTFQQRGDAFGEVVRKFGLRVYSKDNLLDWYRYHLPDISLTKEVKETLKSLKRQGVVLGIISDGRIKTQMNKVKALGLLDYMDEDQIIINDIPERHKPDRRSFRLFMDKFRKTCDFYYVADNPAKDFKAPNALGWTTICLLDDGRNIHPQSFDHAHEFLPQIRMKEFSGIVDLLVLS